MINILISILFGIVEGITEWLPISSTGHMILLKAMVPFDVSDAFYSLYEVIIQLGAILAVVVLFFPKLWPFKKDENHKIKADKDTFILWAKIVVSTLPAFLIVPFDEFFEEKFYNPVSVAVALIVFGIGFILVEKVLHKGKQPKINALQEITFQAALIIGFCQILAAMFPGTSRSGATILGALLIGVSRSVAAEYTFFLAIPAMAGASLLKLIKFNGTMTSAEIGLLGIGLITAFLVSVFVVKALMNYVRKHDFSVFGYYRIVLGIIVLLYFGIKL